MLRLPWGSFIYWLLGYTDTQQFGFVVLDMVPVLEALKSSQDRDQKRLLQN